MYQPEKQDVLGAVDSLSENTSARLSDNSWHIPTRGSLMKCYFWMLLTVIIFKLPGKITGGVFCVSVAI